MNKLKTKLDGALKDIRMTDGLKGEIIAMTEKSKTRISRKWIPIAVAACLILALTGGAYAAGWFFEDAPDITDIKMKGYEYDRAAPNAYNEEGVKALLTESDGTGGMYGDYDRETLAEINDFLGVELYESDILTPCDENSAPPPHRKSGIVNTLYNLHAYEFPTDHVIWVNVWKDYHAPNGDFAESRWTFMADDRKLSGGMVFSYPSDMGLEIKSVSLTSENGLTARLLFAKEVEGNYWDSMDHEAMIAISGYDYHYGITFPNYTCTDEELADLAQEILDSLPAAN